MMKQYIVITYKNGISVNIDIPAEYYRKKYEKKPEKKLHSIFKKEYNSFIKKLNKEPSVVNVGEYLKFSNATISGKDVLSVDVKDLESESKPLDNTIFIPGVHDKVYLDLTDTRLDNFLNRLEELQVVENMDKLVQKLVSFFNKSNVEFTVKAGKKPATTSRKKKEEQVIDSH